jgi:peptidoglycan/xylan/chitin deacetylase (PgdA/CDA1 family)
MIPFPFVRTFLRTKPTILLYHIVTDRDVPHVKHLYPVRDVASFVEDLDFLERRFSIVPMNALKRHLYEGESLPPYPLIITFDDGYREIHDVLFPLLRERSIPATFFLTTNFIDNKELFYRCKVSLIVDNILGDSSSGEAVGHVRSVLAEEGLFSGDVVRSLYGITYAHRGILERIAERIGLDFQEYLRRARPYATTPQVEEMLADGFSIGAHSLDHPPYDAIEETEQIRQTRESLEFLVDRFGVRDRYFAFPFHDRGIEERYFEETAGSVDLSFGTYGFRKTGRTAHFHRVPMEYPAGSTGRILRYYFIRKFSP